MKLKLTKLTKLPHGDVVIEYVAANGERLLRVLLNSVQLGILIQMLHAASKADEFEFELDL